MVIIGSKKNYLLLQLLSILRTTQSKLIHIETANFIESTSPPADPLFIVIPEYTYTNKTIIDTLMLLRKIHKKVKPLPCIIIILLRNLKNKIFPSHISKINGLFWCELPLNLLNFLNSVCQIKPESNVGNSLKFPIEWVKMLLIDFLKKVRHSMQNQHLFFMELSLKEFKRRGNLVELDLAKKKCQENVLPILYKLDFFVPLEYYDYFEIDNLSYWKKTLISFLEAAENTYSDIEKILEIVISMSKLLDRLNILSKV